MLQLCPVYTSKTQNTQKKNMKICTHSLCSNPIQPTTPPRILCDTHHTQIIKTLSRGIFTRTGLLWKRLCALDKHHRQCTTRKQCSRCTLYTDVWTHHALNCIPGRNGVCPSTRCMRYKRLMSLPRLKIVTVLIKDAQMPNVFIQNIN